MGPERVSCLVCAWKGGEASTDESTPPHPSKPADKRRVPRLLLRGCRTQSRPQEGGHLITAAFAHDVATSECYDSCRPLSSQPGGSATIKRLVPYIGDSISLLMLAIVLRNEGVVKRLVSQFGVDSDQATSKGVHMSTMDSRGPRFCALIGMVQHNTAGSNGTGPRAGWAESAMTKVKQKSKVPAKKQSMIVRIGQKLFA